MPLFIKRPVVVEAMQYGPDSMPSVELCLFLSGTKCTVSSDGISIKTKNGTVLVTPGDWIIKLSPDDYYPVANEVFTSLYDPYVQ